MTDALQQTALRSRRFEERLRREFHAGRVPGLIHLQNGRATRPGRGPRSVRGTGAVAVIVEGHARCGIARDLAAQIAAEVWASLRAAPAVVAAPYDHVPFSPLARRVPPAVERVVEIGRVLARSR